MLSFLFVILVSQISALKHDSFNEQNEYINKMQEIDKKDFLERIVRRIAGEVALKDLPLEKSKNISNAELEKHSSYVKKIIEEEKAKLEKEISIKKPSQNSRSFNYSHFDFTLDEQKRNRRSDSKTIENVATHTEEDVTVPVKTVYDSVDLDPVVTVAKDDIQVKGFRSKSRRSAVLKHVEPKKNENTVVLPNKKKDEHENADESVLNDKMKNGSNTKDDKLEENSYMKEDEVVSSHGVKDDSIKTEEEEKNYSQVKSNKSTLAGKEDEGLKLRAGGSGSLDGLEKDLNTYTGKVITSDEKKDNLKMKEDTVKYNTLVNADRIVSSGKVEEDSNINEHRVGLSEKVKDDAEVKIDEIILSDKVERASNITKDETVHSDKSKYKSDDVKADKALSSVDAKVTNEDVSSVTERSEGINLTVSSDPDNYAADSMTTTTYSDKVAENNPHDTIITSKTDDSSKVSVVIDNKEKQLDPNQSVVKANKSTVQQSVVKEKAQRNNGTKKIVTTFSTVKIISDTNKSTITYLKPSDLTNKKKSLRSNSKLSLKTNVSRVQLHILRSDNIKSAKADINPNKNEVKGYTLTTMKLPVITYDSNNVDELSTKQDLIDSNSSKMTKDISKKENSNEEGNKKNIDLDAKTNAKISELKDDIKTLEIAQYVVKALRTGINKDTTKNINANMKTKNNVDVYGLYDDIKEHVQEKNKKNLEQPYYVPVYSFSEKNAYYNAYNKYGPNHEEDKGKVKDTLQSYSDESEDRNKFNVNRAFYKTPHAEHGKYTPDVDKATMRTNLYPILPPVNGKTPTLQQFDYDYFFGKIENEERALRSQNEVKYSEVYLKDRIKNIRQSMYNYNNNYKEISKVDNDKKSVKEKYVKGWLDPRVEYHTNNNIPKLLQNIEPIDYDYLGDYFGDRNNILSDILKSEKDVTKQKRVKNRNVTVDNKKEMTDKSLKFNIKEFYPLLKKLVKIVEFEEDAEVEACIRVMGDFIKTDNDGLTQYDWLESTVNVQSAIEKLTDLTSAVLSGETIHPADLELLKFTTIVHTYSEATKNEPSGKRSMLPKPKKKKKDSQNFKNKPSLYRMPDSGYEFDYKGLQKFLDNLADNLYDFHNAIKHISMVTTLTNQNWFRNLKELYLRKPSRKQLLELILHLGSTRLFNLIEDSSKNGLEENFVKYVLENELELTRITDAFTFLLKVLDAAMDNRLIENY